MTLDDDAGNTERALVGRSEIRSRWRPQRSLGRCLSSNKSSLSDLASKVSRAGHNAALLNADTTEQFSYTPYSKFRIVAALLAEDGLVIKGACVDNPSYGECEVRYLFRRRAKRTALVKAADHCGKSRALPAVHINTAVCEPRMFLLTDRYALPTEG